MDIVSPADMAMRCQKVSNVMAPSRTTGAAHVLQLTFDVQVELALVIGARCGAQLVILACSATGGEGRAAWVGGVGWGGGLVGRERTRDGGNSRCSLRVHRRSRA